MGKDKSTPQVDLSPLLIPNQSDMFNRDITGKVNSNGQTLGKTASTITGAVIPIVIGGVVKPVAPQTSKSLGALAEAEII